MAKIWRQLAQGLAPGLERREFKRMRPRGDSFVRFGSRDTPIRDWTPRGILAGPYTGSLIPRQRVEALICIRDVHDRDGGLNFRAMVEILRVTDRGLVGLFRNLTAMQKSTIAAYYAKKA